MTRRNVLFFFRDSPVQREEFKRLKDPVEPDSPILVLYSITRCVVSPLQTALKDSSAFFHCWTDFLKSNQMIEQIVSVLGIRARLCTKE